MNNDPVTPEQIAELRRLAALIQDRHRFETHVECTPDGCDTLPDMRLANLAEPLAAALEEERVRVEHFRGLYHEACSQRDSVSTTLDETNEALAGCQFEGGGYRREVARLKGWLAWRASWSGAAAPETKAGETWWTCASRGDAAPRGFIHSAPREVRRD